MGGNNLARRKEKREKRGKIMGGGRKCRKMRTCHIIVLQRRGEY